MKLESVHLKNFRAFKELKLDFHPNLNVIAGINGAGKTTILDICSIFMSHIISQIEKGTSQRAIKINELDIFNKSNETSASAKFKDDFIKNDVNNFIVLNQTRIGFGKSKNNEIDALKKYAQFIQENILALEEDYNIPLFAYYKINRVVLDIPLRVRNKHSFTLLNAYEGSLNGDTSFRLLFEWLREQEDYENEYKSDDVDKNYYISRIREIEKQIEGWKNNTSHFTVGSNIYEKSEEIESIIDSLNNLKDTLNMRLKMQDKRLYKETKRNLDFVKEALQVFVPNVLDIRIRRNPLAMVAIKNGSLIQINQLSDGEKSLLALVGDIARRLILANPSLENPLYGEGIVLIDEIELHLHPKWQREVINKLQKVFPNIQFILTTHSPQVISETPRECLHILSWNNEQQQPVVFHPERSLGLDSSDVLSEIMNSLPINEDFKIKLDNIFQEIDEGNYDEAETEIDNLENQFGELPGTIQAKTHLNFLKD